MAQCCLANASDLARDVDLLAPCNVIEEPNHIIRQTWHNNKVANLITWPLSLSKRVGSKCRFQGNSFYIKKNIYKQWFRII